MNESDFSFDDEPMTRVERIQANKALRPIINFSRLADMFYRRAAKFKMWIPNRINGQKVLKTKSYVWLKRQFNPDHVKARLAKATFKGVIGRLSWKQWERELVNPTPVVPLKKKVLRKNDPKIVQPNTPRLKIRIVRTPYIRPRQVRKAQARLDAELALQA